MVHPFGPPGRYGQMAGWESPRARPQIASVELVPWSVRSCAQRSASRPLIKGEGPLRGPDSSRQLKGSGLSEAADPNSDECTYPAPTASEALGGETPRTHHAPWCCGYVAARGKGAGGASKRAAARLVHVGAGQRAAGAWWLNSSQRRPRA